jgi:hypothetical protein
VTAARLRSVLTAALVATAVFAISPGAARAQDAAAVIPDTTFIPRAHEPISYYTSYDRNVSRAAWLQTLTYAHNAKRVAFNMNASATTVNALQGIESKGLDGDVTGSLNLRATNYWTFSLDGRSARNSNDDEFGSTFAKTDRRQNKLQLRTQYQFSPFRNVSAMGLVFAEFQQDQSVGDRTIPVAQGAGLASHAARDSSYTSGRRDGASGTLTWKPVTWLEIGGTGGLTNINTTTNTVKTDFFDALIDRRGPGRAPPVEFFDSIVETRDHNTNPNGDERIDSHITMTGIKRTTLGLAVHANSADQQYYALTQRQQENYKYGTRSASFHADTAPFTGSQASLDLAVDRNYRDYQLQDRLNSLSHSGSAAGQFSIYRSLSRASIGFLFTRAKAERQVTQNGTVINRAMNLGGARRMSRRIWLDGTGSVSLFTRQYEDSKSDKDDVRGYLNAGGGYLVSQRCSTAVHFSVNRSHSVAIAFGSSGGNNVQTTYQMDALVKLQASPTFSIYQNYQINANYLIYDYDEKRNTLNRIRRIDTTLLDSLFTFATIRLTHNFFFQDRGAYTRASTDEPREYSVDQESYAQNLSVAVNLHLMNGVIAGATQSLANTRNYFPTPALNTNRNRWNLNVGVTVDRELPGELRINGVVQRIGEYTERPGPAPPLDVVDYWLAGITIMKDF